MISIVLQSIGHNNKGGYNMDEGQCFSPDMKDYVSSLSVDSTLELVLMICMMLTMLTLISYICYKIKTKNIWEDLKGRERYTLQVLIFFCLLAGSLYLTAGAVQICAYTLIPQQVQSETFKLFFKSFYVLTLSVGACMTNILLIISYIWEHLRENYFGSRRKNLLLGVFLLLIIAANASVILGFAIPEITPNQKAMVWIAAVNSFVSPALAIVFCFRFLMKLRIIEQNPQSSRYLQRYVVLLMFAAGIRLLYAAYVICITKNSEINYFKVNNDCTRIYKWGIIVNMFVNFCRFFIPIFVIIRIFGRSRAQSSQPSQPSLYQSIHEHSKIDSENYSDIE